MDHDVLSRHEASDAVHELGWRYVLGTIRAFVIVGSLAQSAQVATDAAVACGPDAEDHLLIDLRRDVVVLTARSPATVSVAATDVDVARRVTAAVRARGLATAPVARAYRSVQLLEIAIDALDIEAVRPFWRAVMAYDDEPGPVDPTGPLVDPIGQGPAIWFQQTDAPRPRRNRIHVDISVPHDEAPQRIRAATAAGGTVLSDTHAPAFWTLADAEGNEACVTSWQGRDGQ